MEVKMFLQTFLAALWFSQNISAVPINRDNFGLGCEREVSSKGDNYYTLMVFNSKIDMPCPPGTVYNKHLCDCDNAPAGHSVNDDKTTTMQSTTTSPTTQHTTVVPETTQPLVSKTTTPTTTTTKMTTPKPTAKTTATKPTTESTTDAQTTTPTDKSTSTTVKAPITNPTTTTTTTTQTTTQTSTSTTQQPTTTTKMTTKVMSTTGSATPVTVPSTTGSTIPACRFKADGNGFIENVPGFGDIYSECASGLVFSASSCGCVKTGTTDSTTTTPTATKTVCPYLKQGSGFMEDVPGVGKVWHSCGKDQLFMNSACQCVSKDLVTGTEPATTEMSTKIAITTVATSPPSQGTTTEPARCNNRIKEANGYKEYNNVIMDWVYYECSPSWMFSLSQCDCVDPGTNPIPPSGPPKDCSNFEVKGTGYIEHIANVGAVYNNCPPNKRFSMTACDCIDADDTSHTGDSTNSIRITDSNKVDCVFEAQGDGYTETIPGVGDVYYTCVTNHRFIKDLCRCIDKSITIIDDTSNNTILQTSTLSPATSATDTATEISKSSSTTTSPSTTAGLQCKDRIKSGDGFMEYFESLNDWVFFQCSASQEFDIAECDCVTKGTNPSTRGPKTDCAFEARGNGYIENIPGIGAVYSDCPPTQLFDTSLCACADAGSGQNHDVITITDQNRVQNCAFETRGDGFVEHVVGIGLVYHDCPGSERFVASLCKCLDKDTVIIDNATSLTTTQPSTAYSTRSTRPTSTISTTESTTPDPVTSPPSTTTVTQSTTTDHVVTNKDCLYEQVPGQKREFRAPMTWMQGQYMYFSCNIGQEFDIVACSCVDEKVTTTQPTINPDCPFLPSAIGDNYFRFLLLGIGWVEFSCATGQRYDYSRCNCVSRA